MSNTIYSTFRRWQVAALVFLVLFVVLATGIEAQDDPTLEPTAAPVVVEVESPAEETPTNDLADTPEGKGWLRGLIGILAGYIVGAITTLTGGALLARNTRQDKTVMSFIEKLWASTPANVQSTGKQAASGLKELAEFVEEMTDDVPVADKSPLTDDPLKAQRGVG